MAASKRPPITERMKIDCLLDAFIIICAGCGNQVLPGEKVQWDHRHPLALGGPHEYQNLRPLHYECHKTKTSGTKATTAGSDIHKIRKAERIARGGKTRRGPKMKSGPFPKRRPLDHTLEIKIKDISDGES